MSGQSLEGMLQSIQGAAVKLARMNRLISAPDHLIHYSVRRKKRFFFIRFTEVEPLEGYEPGWQLGEVWLGGKTYRFALGEAGQVYFNDLEVSLARYLNAFRLEDFRRRIPRHLWHDFLVEVQALLPEA